MESIPGYDAWRTRGPEDAQHIDGCPLAEDAPPRYLECGGEGHCECFTATWVGTILRWWYGACLVDEDPECECHGLARDDNFADAECRFDSMREDGLL